MILMLDYIATYFLPLKIKIYHPMVTFKENTPFHGLFKLRLVIYNSTNNGSNTA